MESYNALARGLRSDEVWSCRFLWLVCFMALLPVAVVARLSGWRWRPWPARADGYQSVVQESRRMSTALAGSVFTVV